LDCLRVSLSGIELSSYGRAAGSVPSDGKRNGGARQVGVYVRIAVLVEGGGLAKWQLDSLKRLKEGHSFYVLNAVASERADRKLKHAAYYLLNLFTVRNRETRRVALDKEQIPIDKWRSFSPSFEKQWAVLPDEVLDWIKVNEIDVVVKFGLSLLRVPDETSLSVPIISFHHGDPRYYRGRPAGFYEMLEGKSSVGQIVQVLSNILDGGRVIAFGETRVIRHSYRSTLMEMYRLSPFLLQKAIYNLNNVYAIDFSVKGRNYRLPSNWLVVKFLWLSFVFLARRLVYGAFFEKAWKIGVVGIDSAESVKIDTLVARIQRKCGEWTVPQLIPPYSFFADGFPSKDGTKIYAEAMNKRTGKGELVVIEEGDVLGLGGINGHVSYPCFIEVAGKPYILPETASCDDVAIYSIENGRAIILSYLDIDSKRLIDPTLFVVDDIFYLFANCIDDGTNALHLWTASKIDGKFRRHPSSPICVSSFGARMAGQIIELSEGIFRLGQDFRRGYGDGLIYFRIDELSVDKYAETRIGSGGFDDVCGPHTLNLSSGNAVFDFYQERFSIFAGIRRILAKF
jgi:hypothetical protein